MRGPTLTTIALLAAAVPGAAIATGVSNPRPPSGLYGFDGNNGGLSRFAHGSLVVNGARNRVSKISFQLAVHRDPGSSSNCVSSSDTASSVLVKVRGSLRISRGTGQVRESWVVGLNRNGLGGAKATFIIGTQPPIAGRFALQFTNYHPATAILGARFGRCQENYGDSFYWRHH
jgi:hypothetical protein